jgi:hypothetical protein
MSADGVPGVADTGAAAVDPVEMPIAGAEFACQARVPGGGVCGATARHATNPNMCSAGHFIVGNQQRRTHGVRSFEQRGPTALPDVLRQTVEQFRTAIIADRGGAVELSTLEAAYIRRLSEVEAVARLLAADLARRDDLGRPIGLMTARGRVRGTFSRWLEAIDRWDRLAQRIGTDRRAQSMSLTQRLAAAPVLSGTEVHDADE